MSKFFIDTEFIEDGKTIDLISIGIVCEDGREYYALCTEVDVRRASEWVKENVLPHLPPRPENVNFSDPSISPNIKESALKWKSRQRIAQEIVSFVSHDGSSDPVFWAYYADYDWVAFCQVFGKMMDLPEGFPMYCLDIKQECDRLGNPRLPDQKEGEHNALEDARWNKKAWEFLQTYESYLASQP